MTNAEKAKRIGEILDSLYPMPEVPLAYRDPYTLLIAVVLSAQCTDVRVNQVTQVLFARARTPQAMLALGVPAIYEIIRSCGLAPAKSRNIHELSKLLIERHAGEVPRDFEALEALPGVGHKSASIVMSQAFGVPAFAVDTHIHRLAERFGMSSGRNVVETERDLKAVFPERDWIRRHLQLVHFGREHCPARGHDPAGCPICSWAQAKRASSRSSAAEAAARPARSRARGRSRPR